MDWDKLLVQSQEIGLRFGLRIVAAIAVFIIGRWVAKFLTRMIRRGLERADADQTLIRFLTNLVYALLLILVILVALNQLGVQMTTFVAVLGAAGLAIGLALQGSLSNFAAGVLIILFRPYRVGDYVEAGGTSGTVEEVQIFNTVLNTPDNKRVIVPNAQITSGTITNFSANAIRRIDLVFAVGYGEDLNQVRSIIEEVLAGESRMLSEPPPTIGVLELADSSVNFAVRPWVKTEDFWPTRFALQEAMKKRFDAAGIVIPFPQRDVHLHTLDEAAQA